MPFTSETAKQARAGAVPRFDRKAWSRAWARKERARRKAVGVCQMCGNGLVERFAACLECRQKHAAVQRERQRVRDAKKRAARRETRPEAA